MASYSTRYVIKCPQGYVKLSGVGGHTFVESINYASGLTQKHLAKEYAEMKKIPHAQVVSTLRMVDD